jgi:hypothetical protein
MGGFEMKRLLFAAATALLSPLTAQAAAIDLSRMTLNGGATATANELTLIDGQTNMASSAFMAAVPTPSQFSGSFDFTLSQYKWYSTPSDGLSFMIQNDPRGAEAGGNTSNGGGSIGTYGIQNAVGIGFQSYINNHATIFSSTNSPYAGTQPLGNFDLGSQPVDTVHVAFNYANDNLSYSAFNNNTGQFVKDSIIFDIGQLGPEVFIGFTGGSGAWTSVETVSNFQISTVAGVPEPATWAMMGLGFAGLGFIGRRRNKTASAAGQIASPTL